MGSLRIAVGSDHGGFEQKEIIAKRLTAGGCEVTDFGCSSTESVDYPDYAAPVAQAVARGDADFGILVCGTGIGMMLAANKVKGIRAANVTSVEFAHLAREHNNANVVTLSGRFVDPELNWQIVNTSLSRLTFRGDEATLASFNSRVHLELLKTPELITYR